jgi:mannosyltransferase
MLIVDGIIYSLQRHGGITVYFNELLSSAFDRGAIYRALVYDGASSHVDSLPGDVLKLERRFAERYRSCAVPRNASVFHSSYYRLPDRPVPIVTTVHDFTYERYANGPRRWVHSWQKFEAIRESAAIICISESTREDLLSFVGVRDDQSVHVIPNGVSKCFRPISIEPPLRPFLLFVGERGGYKNFSLLLSALAFLPDLEVHCLGGGPLHYAEIASSSPSVRARVRHLGFVTDEALNKAYNQAVCLVYPSRYEGFGIPVVEAMKAGCPVVSVNCKAVIEIGGHALELLPEEDPRALALAVERLREPAYRAQRIAAGLERASIYDWKLCHDQTLAVYRSLSDQV